MPDEVEIETQFASTPFAAPTAYDQLESFPPRKKAERSIAELIVDVLLHAGVDGAALHGEIYRDPTSFPILRHSPRRKRQGVS